MNGRRDLGVAVSRGRDIERPLGQLLGCVEALAIAKQLQAFRCRDIAVRGVKPFLCRRLGIGTEISRWATPTHKEIVSAIGLGVRIDKDHDRVGEGVDKCGVGGGERSDGYRRLWRVNGSYIAYKPPWYAVMAVNAPSGAGPRVHGRHPATRGGGRVLE